MFYLEFNLNPKNIPLKSLEFDTLLFLLASLSPARKQSASKNSQVNLLTGTSQISQLSMRSKLMYNHMTFQDLFNKHIPHTNISAASTIPDQPSPPTAHVWRSTTSAKQSHCQITEDLWMKHRCVAHVEQRVTCTCKCGPVCRHHRLVCNTLTKFRFWAECSQSQDLPLSSEKLQI